MNLVWQEPMCAEIRAWYHLKESLAVIVGQRYFKRHGAIDIISSRAIIITTATIITPTARGGSTGRRGRVQSSSHRSYV
eukprot:12139718-Karenia_brevis.AAC.1